MPSIFDNKIWNDEVFQAYMDSLDNIRHNELIKSRPRKCLIRNPLQRYDNCSILKSTKQSSLIEKKSKGI